MLSKERRINKSYFPYIIKNGTRSNSSLFLVYVAKVKDKNIIDKSRFSFSVSKKVTNSAVLRNKLRRRGYSVIQGCLKSISEGHFFFFVYKKGAEKAGFDKIREEIIKLLSIYVVVE